MEILAKKEPVPLQFHSPGRKENQLFVTEGSSSIFRSGGVAKNSVRASSRETLSESSHHDVVARDCGYPVSRYTCRATRVAADFLDFRAFCRCSTGVALHPQKILASPLPPPLAPEVSHRNLGLKRCRATRGCRSYSCGCRATLCN